MKVILLCAGYATRLYPLTKNQPKPLLPVGDRTILEWILARVLEIQEVQEVFIVTNHRFAGHFETWRTGMKYPWPIKVVDDQTTTNENRLGAIGDLRYVLEQNRIKDEDLLVIAGDNLFDFDLTKFVTASKRHRPHSVIAVFDVGDKEMAKRYGIVECNPDRRVLQFHEKPSVPPSTLASCGIYWLPAETRVLLDKYLAEGNNPDQPGHYMRWLSENNSLFAVPLEGRWLDIGDPETYQTANTLFKETPRKN